MNRLNDNPMLKYSSFVVIVVFLFTNSLLFAQESMQEERPNFIVIFADDLGYGDVGSAGSDLIQTPHEYLYLFNNEEITAVRSQRWKFVIRSYYRTGLTRFYGERQGGMHYYHPGLLFDLDMNPEEQFSYTREQPEIVEKMLERLERGRAELEVLGNQ